MKVVAYLYVTDICPRLEFEDLDSYRIQRRFGEKLLYKIPLYSDVKEEDYLSYGV